MNKNDEKLNRILSILPPIEKVKISCEADYYGISTIVAKKLHLPFIPRSPVGWKHGWLFADLKYKEQIVSWENGSNYLVPLSKQKKFLKKYNIEAKAVGLPFVYAEDIETQNIKRESGSLLVMPPHSLPYTNHSLSEEKYVESIAALHNKFDLIVVCIHQSCIEKKLWVDSFAKYNIPYIIGANAEDKNSLIRMYRIFKSFEYMTTNTIGSHIIYGAYCGCKISIFGQYANFSANDYRNDPFYQKFPFLLEHNIKESSEECIQKLYPFLFSHPLQSKIHIEWAKEELGYANKVTFLKLAFYLGWSPLDQLIFYAKKIYNKIKILCAKKENQ